MPIDTTIRLGATPSGAVASPLRTAMSAPKPTTHPNLLTLLAAGGCSESR